MATRDLSASPLQSFSDKTNVTLSTETHGNVTTEVQARSENAEPSTGPSTIAIASDASNTQTVLQATSGVKTAMAHDQSEQDASFNQAAPASPPTPQQTGNKLPRPRYKDEKILQSYIAKAHAQAREGIHVASSIEEQEKAVVKYAEIVSQMTYLLATLGVGRNTTVRALAYLDATDPPDVKTALRQAKQDRREQNTKKRQTSEASSATRKNERKNADNTSNKTLSTFTSSNNSTDGSVCITNPTLAVTGQTSLTEMSVLDTVKSENRCLDAVKTNAATDAPGMSNGGVMQKKRFTRKWWGKTRRRNRGTSDEANKKTQATDKGPKLNTNSTGAVSHAALTVAAPPTA
ncbi:hypothetical protein DV736_g966, partial [Chaetothyriales sp. CBS 134916]